MKPFLFVRALTDEEDAALRRAARSDDAFARRRAAALRLSAQKRHLDEIADALDLSTSGVRRIVHDFHDRGLDALRRQPMGPKAPTRIVAAETAERLVAIAHQSPRDFGKTRSTWTLPLLAEVAFAEGLTAREVSGETIRQAIVALGYSWQRAKKWIRSPDPQYDIKKRQRDRLIALAAKHDDWVVGYQDEVWWSRFAQPSMHAWADEADPLRLVQRHKRKDDPEPKALACYGVYVPEWAAEPGGSMLLRFVRGRPVSHVTTAFLAWATRRLATRGVRVWVLVWDNAPWHISAEVQAWLRSHNHAVKRRGRGVRIVACGLPTRSPWLNPIEPKWLHGKRATCEPDAEVTIKQLRRRLCAHYGCQMLPEIKQKTS